MKIRNTKISKRTLALFAAAVLMLSGGVAGTTAELTAQSVPYDAQLDLDQIQVALVENGTVLENNATLLKNTFTSTKGKLAPGYPYTEKIAAANTNPKDGADEYIRIIVRKYWKTEEIAKDLEKVPGDILLCMGGNKEVIGSGWTENEAEATAETNVYYYSSKVAAGAQTSELFDTLIVDGKILKDYEVKTTAVEGGTKYTYVYNYDGYSVCVEAEAQAVQTHNAKDAIKSIWGVDASSVGINVQ